MFTFLKKCDYELVLVHSLSSGFPWKHNKLQSVNLNELDLFNNNTELLTLLIISINLNTYLLVLEADIVNCLHSNAYSKKWSNIKSQGKYFILVVVN